MTPVPFELAPHPGLPVPADVRIHGSVERTGPTLRLTWRLEAPAGTVAMAAPVARPERRRALWEDTCFECFLAAPGRPGYWELNLSPAGHWNVYRLEAYRSGMTEESAIEALPSSVSRHAGGWEVSTFLDTTDLGLAAAPWRLAVATVVAAPGGRVTYWALAHPGGEPDFHHPDAFRLRLQAGSP